MSRNELKDISKSAVLRNEKRYSKKINMIFQSIQQFIVNSIKTHFCKVFSFIISC